MADAYSDASVQTLMQYDSLLRWAPNRKTIRPSNKWHRRSHPIRLTQWPLEVARPTLMRAGGSPDWGFSLISLSLSCSDYPLHFNHFIVSIVSPFDHVSLFLFLLIFMMYISLCYCFAISLMKSIWKRTRNISLSISIFRFFISSRCKTSKTASNMSQLLQRCNLHQLKMIKRIILTKMTIMT